MKRTGWPGAVALAKELLVVFVGLFAALQLDDWRERREQAKTETIYLHRLSEDLHAYVESLELVIPTFESHRRAVQHVSDSLAAGRLGPQPQAWRHAIGTVSRRKTSRRTSAGPM